MDVKNMVSQSDEEEDLEALRLAALQSLKKNAAPSQFPTGRGYANHRRFRQGHSYGQSGRFQSNRVGQHSNLIPLTKVEPQTPRPQEPVFLLPQDKYVAKNNLQDSTRVKKSDSKFDRYNDTDKSDEEDSEEELLRLHSDEEEDDEGASPQKLERSDSLEALMQELDDEIKGASKPKVDEQEIVKVESAKDKSPITVQEPTSSTVKAEEAEVTSSVEAVVKETPENPPEDDNKNQTPECVNTQKPVRSPYHRGKFYNKRGRHQNFNRQAPIQLPVAPFLINPNPLAFLPNIPPPPIYPNNHSLFMPMNAIPSISPFYTRPVSPLQINTETLQTQTRAPLSPRSAAFVLQNRAIIEKRKRRSYSRSPSPRGRSLSPRRSRSPLPIRKRSMSPPLRKRSPSPLRKRSKSPLRKRSLSPKRRNYSPKRRSASPIKRRSVSPKRNEKKEPNNAVPRTKPSIRDRLGLKSNVKPEETEIKEKPIIDSPSKDDKPLDPILEARKRKFESKEIKVGGGIIRLKPKEEAKPNKVETELEKPQEAEATPKTELVKTEVITEEPSIKKDSRPTARDKLSLEEDVLLEDDELDLEAQVDLFSDEDLISEDEVQLSPVTDVQNSRIVELPEKVQNGKRKLRLSPVKTLSKDRSPSGRVKTRKSELKKSKTSSKKLSVKMERHPKKFDRKIEIKLKNPKSEPDSSEEIGRDREKPKRARKVEVGNSKKDFLEDDDDDITEIIVESDETENAVSREGDLRAQLSKKRAEKLQKAPTSQDRSHGTSRLLQTALENALPIKKSKKSKSKDLTSSEGKPPIHLRLGIEYNTDIFAPAKPKKRSKKRKHVESEPQ